MLAKVMSVEAVQAFLTRSLPPLLVIHAQGKVNTGGWGPGVLVPYTYITPPQDGFWDFDYLAEPPNGISTSAIAKSEAHLTLLCPDWCKGVRIHAATGKPAVSESLRTDPAEALAALQSAGQANAKKDPIDYFPWKAADPGDSWPWLIQQQITIASHMEQAASQGSRLLMALEPDKPAREAELVESLIGSTLRVLEEGQVITMEYLPTRVNVVLKPGTRTIARIYRG